VIVGCGGVGGYFGGRLAQKGIQVTFLVREGETLNNLKKDGLRVDSIKGDFVLSPNQFKVTANIKDIEGADVILVTVKTWQLEEAAKQIKPIVSETTTVIPLLNGVDIVDSLNSILGNKNVVGGSCRIVSFIASPGHIRHQGVPPFIVFGSYPHNANIHKQNLEDLKAIFDSSIGVDATLSPNIDRDIWEKFFFICANAGVTSVTRAPMGIVYSTPETRQMLIDVMRECALIARAKGIDISEELIQSTLERVSKNAKESPGATTSMQRDIEQGKPSELYQLTGTVIRLGNEFNLPVPLNRFIYGSLLPLEMKSRGEIVFP